MNRINSPVRVGVIGAGFVAQLAHLNCLRGIPGCVLTGLAELRPQLRHDVAAEYGLPVAVETHHELLARDDIDAVVVVTRRNATGPVVLDALRAGKHVLSEKPMAHTSEQGSLLVDAAREARSVFRVGFMKRYDHGVAAALAKLQSLRTSGEAGALVFVRCYSHAGNDGRVIDGLLMTDEPRPEGIALWRAAPDWLPDGMIGAYDGFINIHVHIVNLVRHLLGGQIQIDGFNYRGDGVSTAYGNIAGTPCAYEFAARDMDTWVEGIEFVFESGNLALRLQPPFAAARVAAAVWTDRCGNERTLGDVPAAQWQFDNQAASFIDAVAAGRPETSSAEDHLLDLAAIEAMWQHPDFSHSRSDQV